MATEVKPRSNRLLMVLGIIVAAVAFILVLVVGGGGKSSGPSADRTRDVVVAAVDIPVGTQISEQLVTTVKYAPDQVPVNVFTSAKKCDPKAAAGTCTDPIGQFANVAISKNMPLTTSVLVATVGAVQAQKKPYLDIPSGQLAISVPAGGELQTVGGFIQPGDRVDIIFEPADKPTDKVTFQDVVIQRVGAVGVPSTQGVASSYIVYVSPDDAELMMFMFAHGTWKYALTSQLDAAKPVPSGPTTQGVDTNKFKAKFGF
ncbi:MAG TPA: RcpC/CpaB family pilus assembly protein [Candidatus Dormibacteraeota bacterium]|nr:RcpC/CpaB family pilus assembly protein [Candidatus Dormibacteraeota bacterium]